MVAVPLGVVVGLKLPHCALPQVTDQVTPALALSFATVAVKAAAAEAAREAGGLLSVTVMGALGVEIVMAAEADCVESAMEVAVTVTVAGLGAVAGAVYLVATPLAVEAAERLPHCELPQLTAHLTPAFALSLLTTAVRLMVEPASVDDGGCGLKATERAGGLGEEPDPPQPVIRITRTIRTTR